MPSNPQKSSAEPASPSLVDEPAGAPLIEPLLLAAARVNTFLGQGLLTNASGFFLTSGCWKHMLIVSSRALFNSTSLPSSATFSK
jgi:hypothetical protein